jgi:hypothetical protein
MWYARLFTNHFTRGTGEEGAMRIVARRTSLVVLAALVLSSCATTVIESSYQIDFRNMSVPVMLNEPKTAPVGRTVPISFTFSSSTSTTTGYNVTITTTRTSQSTVPIAYQLLMNMNPNDAAVVLRDIVFNYHIMMAPYYGENSRRIDAEAVILPKGRLQ